MLKYEIREQNIYLEKKYLLKWIVFLWVDA